MITAMSTDYRSVYYVDLDNDEGICFRGDPEDDDQSEEGVRFPYHERFVYYADNYVDANYREGFISFIDPENIRDGLEATRKIRAMTREDCAKIPIIALTANAFDEDVQRSLQAGLNAHLSKPIQQEVLFETLESLIKPCDADTEGGAG